MAKETEYGGEETLRSQGIQPKEADADLKSGERLRLVYATDPAEADEPDRYTTPVYLREGE